ncbi:MAG: LCP family protein [Dethiobacteria bacterium]|nr:LCP family protein [Bacillota bacterium]
MKEEKRLSTVSPATTGLSLCGLLLLAALVIYLTGNLYASFFSLVDPMVETIDRGAFLSTGNLPGDKPVTFLLFGIDSGEWVGGTYREGTGRADTIVLVQADPLSQKAALLSIPRDTLVEIPGRPGDDKINHAYAFGQAPLLVETVEHFTGVPVDGYVGLNYRAFKDIVDLLGGVEFDVDRVITCRGLRLEPGRQHLDGDAAFALVSFRNEPMGDIGRVRRQQRFIKAVAGSARQSSLDQLFYIMLAAWDNLDTDISFPEAVTLSRRLSGITEENMAMELVPGCFYNRNGVSYWRPYLDETEKVIQDLFFNLSKDVTP